MSTMPRNATEAVARGAALLDEKVPGWWRVIDLDALDMGNCTQCMLGQLFGHDIEKALGSTTFGLPLIPGYIPLDMTGFGRGCETLGIRTSSANEIGCNDSYRFSYADLKCEWTRVIAERRAAEIEETV